MRYHMLEILMQSIRFLPREGEFLLTQEGDVISPIPEKAGDELKYDYKITFTGIPSAPVVNMPSYEHIF